MTTIKLKAACLQTWCANGKEQRLFTEFMEIEKAAKDAQARTQRDEVRQGLRATSGADGNVTYRDIAKAQLKVDEGIRLKPYRDSLGMLSDRLRSQS
jgi:hypothetical protein